MSRSRLVCRYGSRLVFVNLPVQISAGTQAIIKVVSVVYQSLHKDAERKYRN
jgi:hypothetical protein